MFFVSPSVTVHDKATVCDERIRNGRGGRTDINASDRYRRCVVVPTKGAVTDRERSNLRTPYQRPVRESVLNGHHEKATMAVCQTGGGFEQSVRRTVRADFETENRRKRLAMFLNRSDFHTFSVKRRPIVFDRGFRPRTTFYKNSRILSIFTLTVNVNRQQM